MHVILPPFLLNLNIIVFQYFIEGLQLFSTHILSKFNFNLFHLFRNSPQPHDNGIQFDCTITDRVD